MNRSLCGPIPSARCLGPVVVSLMAFSLGSFLPSDRAFADYEFGPESVTIIRPDSGTATGWFDVYARITGTDPTVEIASFNITLSVASPIQIGNITATPLAPNDYPPVFNPQSSQRYDLSNQKAIYDGYNPRVGATGTLANNTGLLSIPFTIDSTVPYGDYQVQLTGDTGPMDLFKLFDNSGNELLTDKAVTLFPGVIHVVAVPEPSTIVLFIACAMSLAGLGAARCCRRRRHACTTPDEPPDEVYEVSLL